LIEFGADAMLKAQISTGLPVDPNNIPNIRKVFQLVDGRKGTLVFIPDDKE
jgi:hypothetical protein